MSRIVRDIWVVGALSVPCLASGAVDLPQLRDVTVRATASYDATSSLVEYRYAVENSGSSGPNVDSIAVDLRSDDLRAPLDPGVLPSDEKFINSDIGVGPLVPAYSPSAPEGWFRGISAKRELLWDTIDDSMGTGETRAPFVLLSPGLPGIRTITIRANLYKFLPVISEEISPEEIFQAIDSAAGRRSTIGPVAPPAEFDPASFLEEILGLRAQAEAQGWIRPSAQVATVDGLLNRLREEIASAEFSDARLTAEEAAAEVERISCAELSCAATAAMTSEARALLAINLRYLRAQITPAEALATLISLGSSITWIGLKNSDDQGTSFDLRAEFSHNGTPISTGQIRCIAGVTRNPNLAKEARVPFNALSSEVSLSTGDVISLKLLTRIGTNPNDTKCSGHANAVGLRLYYNASNRPSRFDAEITPSPLQGLFLNGTDTGSFDANAPTGGAALFKDSPSIKFSGGNAWKEIGTWSVTQP